MKTAGSSMAASVRVVVAYPAAVVRVLSRDPTALFFSLFLPVALIVTIGLAFGGTNRLDVAAVDADRSELSADLIHQIEANPGLRVRRIATEASLREALDRKEVVAGLVVPAGTAEAVASGRPAPLRVVAQTADSQGLAAYLSIQTAIAPVNASVIAASLPGTSGGASFEEGFRVARPVASAVPSAVDVQDVGGSRAVRLNKYSQTAAQNLVLFVFTIAMVSASIVVAARRHGVLHRSLSTRASPTQVLAGLCLAISVVTVVQSAIVIVVGAVVFRVEWGDPWAALLLVLSADFAAAAAGTLLGAVGRNPDRTAALAPIAGIGLAVIGGCVIPLEVFPNSLVTAAHLVPQYWAIRGWQSLIFDGAALHDIYLELAVLVVVGFTLFVLAVMALSRQMRTTRL